jgi:hypothetical protein
MTDDPGMQDTLHYLIARDVMHPAAMAGCDRRCARDDVATSNPELVRPFD